jgi:hypothetical protein
MTDPTGTGAEERRSFYTIRLCPECGAQQTNDRGGETHFMDGLRSCPNLRKTWAVREVEVVPASDLAALQERLEEEQATARRLHRALSEGYGVEDGGIWEDRALAAEAERDSLAEQVEVLERENAALVAELNLAQRLLRDARSASNQQSEEGR